MSEPKLDMHTGPERRTGKADRRVAAQDRRNEDRLAEELLPRRNPEIPDRRKH